MAQWRVLHIQLKYDPVTTQGVPSLSFARFFLLPTAKTGGQIFTICVSYDMNSLTENGGCSETYSLHLCRGQVGDTAKNQHYYVDRLETAVKHRAESYTADVLTPMETVEASKKVKKSKLHCAQVGDYHETQSRELQHVHVGDQMEAAVKHAA